MNSRAALNIAIAVATLAVGAFMYYSQQKAPTDTAEHFPLISERVEDVVRIEIRRRAQSAIALERRGTDWRMTEPHQARLDEVQLARVLDVARFRATQRMHADDLGRFELDKPWAQIRFNRHAVDFGTINPVTHELYLKSGDHVYAVPSRLGAAVPGDAGKLLAHRLFAPDEQPVAFELKGFVVKHDGVRWMLTPPDPALSQDDLVRWVDQWRIASSIVTQPGAAMQPAESLKIELRDGRTIAVAVLERIPNLVLQRQDEMLQYHLPAERAAALLAAPNGSGAPKP